MRIKPTDGSIEHRACRLTLKDGRTLDRVAMAPAKDYLRVTKGLWPDNLVPLEDVVAVAETPCRVPAQLVNKMYSAGESAMAAYVLTLVLSDGRRLPYVVSGLVDFPNLPPGVKTSDIIDLLPHEAPESLWKRGEFHEHMLGADYHWCLYP